MTGLMIFNAHPRLYWGQYGANFDHAWLVLGSSDAKPFPSWATIPSTYSLADARIWHFAFAWIFASALTLNLLISLFNGHIWRDLRIRSAQLSPAYLWSHIKAHARLEFHDPHAPLDYNIFQKLSYGAVLFGLLPLMILTGLTMSPAMDAAWPWLLDIFGGRQSARSIHFICAFSLLAFFAVHMLMVVLAGPINEIRSMITGNFRIPPHDATSEASE